MTDLLSVSDLTIDISTRRGELRAIDGVSFGIGRGEVLGVVGESGAGKSMLGNAVIGLLPARARIAGGQVWLDGDRIDALPRADLQHLRGARIGMIFQDPQTSLNPLYRIGDQITQTIRTHRPMSQTEALDEARRLLTEVGISASSERLAAYPHQFSGGMRQRVVIALALAGNPELVIADEPTTALDVSVQAQIIKLLKRLCQERGVAVMLITHDMGVIAETADRVCVLYAGRVAEIGAVDDVLARPRHPYTQGLMAANPTLTGPLDDGLRQIPGSMPTIAARPKGCAFHPRCSEALALCRDRRPPLITAQKVECSCFLYHQDSQALKAT
ncbi:MAG: ABC transporter ATP-binding protein [Phyllobacteriaceae bacterium]|nr:ABC transporter ATP-binding protein [Phyllobacteriaceae bacterium]